MKIRCSAIFVGAAASMLLISCNALTEDDVAIARKIEMQVTNRVPDMDLKNQARFYAHSKAGRVFAIYIYGADAETAMVGIPGTSSWVTEQNLPVVNDGGCSVVHIVFDTKKQKIEELYCNGEA
jgi:hypothetical protein